MRTQEAIISKKSAGAREADGIGTSRDQKPRSAYFNGHNQAPNAPFEKKPKTPSGKFKSGPAADKGRAVIKEALEQHKGPMSPMQLGEALTRSGLVFVNPSETACRFMRGWTDVERIGHGLYELASADAVSSLEEDINDPTPREGAPTETLAEFVLAQLRRHDRPVRLKELVRLAQQHGYRSGYLSSSIAGAISKNKWAVLVGRGLYMLASEKAWEIRAENEENIPKASKGSRLLHVRNLLRKVFTERQAPMRLTELTEIVKESGFDSRNHMAIVSEVVRKYDEFERVGYGVYRHQAQTDQAEQEPIKPYLDPYSEITGFIIQQMEALKRPVGRAELRHLAILNGYDGGSKLDHSIASALKGSRFKKVQFLGYVPAETTGSQ